MYRMIKAFQDKLFNQQFPILTRERALNREEIAQSYTKEILKRVVISEEAFYEQRYVFSHLPKV